MAPGLNYGQQAYEGLKAFRHASGQITIFRPDCNAKRMAHSAEFVSIPPVPEELFVECVKLALGANAEFVPPHKTGAAMYIRPMIFGSSAQLGLTPPDDYTFAVFVTPTGVYHGTRAVDALILEDFDRAAPLGTGSAKVGGNYAPVLRHSDRAKREGYGITLHLDSRTRSEVDEFTTSAFLAVKQTDQGGTTLVQPDSPNVIDSVTAASVCEIGQKLFSFNVEKRRVPYEEIREFREILAAGTAAALVPIRSITMQSKGDRFEFECGGEAQNGGHVFLKLLQTLRGIQTGTIKDAFAWNLEVDRPPQGWADDIGGHESKELEDAVNMP